MNIKEDAKRNMGRLPHHSMRVVSDQPTALKEIKKRTFVLMGLRPTELNEMTHIYCHLPTFANTLVKRFGWQRLTPAGVCVVLATNLSPLQVESSLQGFYGDDLNIIK